MKITKFLILLLSDMNIISTFLPPAYLESFKKMSEVLDLSTRRDSVESRKTPSPYNISSVGTGSPIDSPATTNQHAHSHHTTTTILTSNSSDEHNSRTNTPLHHYPSPPTEDNNYNQYSPTMYHSVYSCPIKREATSPIEMNTYENKLNADYMLHAAVLQQRMSQQETNSRNKTPLSSGVSEEPCDRTFVNSVAHSPNPSNPYPMVVGRDGKLSRPFKAYPRDPLSITAAITSTADVLMDAESNRNYQVFRQKAFEHIHAANGGQATISNPKMRRISNKQNDHHNTSNENEEQLVNGSTTGSISGDSASGNNVKDSAYFERRKKNNAAAKKSRDRRRIKEDEIAIRAAYLERENIQLRYEVMALQKQLDATRKLN